VEEPKLGLDPIVIDPANEWVYYGSIHGTSVYRVRAADLLDESFSPDALGERVERYGEKAPCDGISIDDAGNIYITDLENNAIGVTAPDGSYRVLARDNERLIWPDGFSYGPDGYFYVTATQLQRSAVFNAGEETSETPFLVLRFRPLAPSAIGR
jgi:sugar lactone lactonase YvrE